jgi:FdhD protein
MNSVSFTTAKVKKINAHQFIDDDDQLAVEEPLAVELLYGNKESRIRKPVSVTMRTPGHDKELAVGFLFTEGIIRHSSQVSAMIAGENKVVVSLNEDVVPILHQAERNFYTTSSCGVCGKRGIDAIRTTTSFEKTYDDIQLEPSVFYDLERQLKDQQFVFRSTGGLHASALFDLDGTLAMLREDVGRHNALDKLIGSAFLTQTLPLSDSILLLSGRASFELIQKAAMAGIKVVAAVGAPSSLAVQLAGEMEMTLIGFLRTGRFNIYSGEQRIAINYPVENY